MQDIDRNRCALDPIKIIFHGMRIHGAFRSGSLVSCQIRQDGPDHDLADEAMRVGIRAAAGGCVLHTVPRESFTHDESSKSQTPSGAIALYRGCGGADDIGHAARGSAFASQSRGAAGR
jgi:hypothetical protein